MTKRRRKRRILKENRNAKLVLKNKSHKYVQAYLSRFPKGLSSADLKEESAELISFVLSKIQNNPRATKRAIGLPFPKSSDDFLVELTSTEGKSLQAELKWNSLVLSRHSEKINSFLLEKLNFENAFLFSKCEDAQNSLVSCLENLGSSLWAVENTVLLADLHGGIGQNRKVTKASMNGIDDYIAKMLVQSASRRAEKDLSASIYVGGVEEEFGAYRHFKEKFSTVAYLSLIHI